MGRPLKKDVKGTEVLGTAVGTAAGIRVSFYDGANLRTDGIIIKQRGAKTFQVARVGTPLVRFSCVLQSTTPDAAFEMQMIGYSGQEGASANAVSIAKLTKRLATDFSGNKYTWYLENDSSADYIVLTPVTA
jgi:hypothetical protein